MDFKKIDNKFRPLPFWSWNDKLNIAETVYQTGIHKDAGLGGFFMHARGGLETRYLSDEWFDNVSAAIKKATECGLRACKCSGKKSQHSPGLFCQNRLYTR